MAKVEILSYPAKAGVRSEFHYHTGSSADGAVNLTGAMCCQDTLLSFNPSYRESRQKFGYELLKLRVEVYLRPYRDIREAHVLPTALWQRKDALIREIRESPFFLSGRRIRTVSNSFSFWMGRQALLDTQTLVAGLGQNHHIWQ